MSPIVRLRVYDMEEDAVVAIVVALMTGARAGAGTGVVAGAETVAEAGDGAIATVGLPPAISARLKGPKYPVEGSPTEICQFATAAAVREPKYPVGRAISRDCSAIRIACREKTSLP